MPTVNGSCRYGTVVVQSRVVTYRALEQSSHGYGGRRARSLRLCGSGEEGLYLLHASQTNLSEQCP